MDILDIMIAKAMSPQGKIDTYAAKAEKAVQSAQTVVNNINSITEQTNTNNENAQAALENANAAVQEYSEIVENLEEIISQVSEVNLGVENSGKMVKVAEDGTLAASQIDETALIDLLIRSGNYAAEGVVGLEIDYVNRVFTRTQEAVGKAAGADFTNYKMYDHRVRCLVDRDGKVLRYNPTVEDGSQGQVMIYQPKFYYNRTVISYENSAKGPIINKEILMLSLTERPGFKLHPLFIDDNGNEIDYVLLSAYESTYYDVSANKIVDNDAADVNFNEDYLMSVAGVKPISGVNKQFTMANAEKMANNIGEGWHITDMRAESANQMLFMVEFGQMNGQIALEPGIVNINGSASINGASITGSTSSLGSLSGAAESTVNEMNGVRTTYTDAGRRAISYRGFENPWGNIYRFVNDIDIYGDGTMGAGMPRIRGEWNIGYQIAERSNWISAMGKGVEIFDWIYMPIAAEGTSLLPVGDFLWTNGTLNGTNAVNIGGTQRMGDNCGLFFYTCDQPIDGYSASQSARIMHIPTYGSEVYNYNIKHAPGAIN